MQAYAIKDAANMLQQYTKLLSGTQLLDFLMHNIEEAERMKIVETKMLAMVVFCAQLNDSAKLYVMSFMTEYLGHDDHHDTNVSLISPKICATMPQCVCDCHQAVIMPFLSF